MYETLLHLAKNYNNKTHALLQNALRKYYKFTNKKEFPTKREFEKLKSL